MGVCFSLCVRPPVLFANPKNRKTCTIKWLEENAQTGDILLFSTISITSEFIENIEGSDWSHVGMIIRKTGQHKWNSHGHTGDLFLWEAEPSADEDIDVISNKRDKVGVRLVSLHHRLQNPNIASMMYRQLVKRDGTFIDENSAYNINHNMNIWINSESRKTFVSEKACMIHSLFSSDPAIIPRSHYPEYFCSQLAICTLMNIGVLPKPESSTEKNTPGINPIRTCPADFGDLYDDNNELSRNMKDQGFLYGDQFFIET
jgi:hypothetical protein